MTKKNDINHHDNETSSPDPKRPKRMTVTKITPDDPSSPVKLTHPSGANATVYPFGATVTSFRTASGRELLFVSSDAKLDGSKAIRGGIPLVFPQFGRPDERLPQHGFLRSNAWTLVEPSKNDDGDVASCAFALNLADASNARGTEGPWSAERTEYDCSASFVVRIGAETLTTVLEIKNAGDKAFDFQTLFHTYYRVENGKALDKELCNVTGLEGYGTEDKITGETYVQDDKPIVVDREVDRIYKNAAKPVLDLDIRTGDENKSVNLKSKARVGGVDVPVSVVVWNPFVEKAKAMSDFTDEQYHDMICVEPGILHDVPVLSKGSTAIFEQVITAL